MTSDGRTAVWRAAMVHFDRLIELDHETRKAALAALATEEPEVHGQVCALLNADLGAEQAGFLDTPIATAFDAGQETLSELTSGTRIGNYELRRLLGTGGMGEVWLAQRDHGEYRQDVALKILRTQTATRQLRERFVREGRFLAQLSHSNIARLFDAGVGEAGRWWLALEYVDGDRIDRWCDGRKLDIEARLRLFLQVCRAVAHAHSRLVVHRDLKPANILVTADGTAKLLDFGIGKLLESDTQPQQLTELTRVDSRLMTPEYAAPEQVLGAPITTATDVHALGVLLYILLCGKHPFANPETSSAELARAIADADPPPPSHRLSTRGPAAETADITNSRLTNTAGLRRALRGDLDDIVAKAMRKAPDRRYPSALALAEDIERHLRHDPVEARAGSRSYRAVRFMRRHRTALLAAGIAALALLTGLAIAVWQANIAREEARKATAIKDFLVGVFERNSLAHPDGARARRTTAEELLAQSARQIRAELRESPEIRRELLGVMAQLYSSLDLQNNALSLLQDKLASERIEFGATSLPVARTLSALAYSQIQVGQWPAAERTADEAVRIFVELGEDSQLEYAIAHANLGQAAMRLGKLQDGTSQRHFRAALELLETHHPRNAWRIEALNGLSRVATHANNNAQSLAFAKQALALIESKAVDVDRMTRGGVHQRIGNALTYLNRHTEAELHMRAAIQDYEQAGGAEHSFTIDGKRELGVLLTWTGRRTDAKSLLSEVLAAQERIKGPDDPELTTFARYDYGFALLQRGEWLEAEKELLRSEAAWRGSGSATLSNVHGLLGRVYVEQGRLDHAQRFLDGLEESAMKVFGKGSWNHLASINRNGQLRLAQRRPAEARALFERVWTDYPDPAGERSVNLTDAAIGLARLDLAAGNTRAARDRLTSLVRDIERSPARPDMPDQEATAHMLLASAIGTGDADAAVRAAARAVELRTRLYDPASVWLAEARLHLAQAHWRAGNRRLALDAFAAADAALQVQSLMAENYQRLWRQTRALLRL